MHITVVNIGSESIHEYAIELATGATVADALTATQVTLGDGDAVAIYGRKTTLATVLEEGDRIEVARALVCDPKLVRRERARAQGDIRIITAGRHGGRRHVELDTSEG